MADLPSVWYICSWHQPRASSDAIKDELPTRSRYTQTRQSDEALLQQILDLETVFMCVCFVLVPGSLFIQNASGIQIGSNNLMSIRGYDSSHSLLSHPNGSANFLIKEGILKYGKPQQCFFQITCDIVCLYICLLCKHDCHFLWLKLTVVFIYLSTNILAMNHICSTVIFQILRWNL